MSSFKPGQSWRIVLIGRTGVGKSAAGNTILGRQVFLSAPNAESVTNQCQKEEKIWNDRLVTVVDTPGIMDTNQTPEFIKKEIVRCVQLSCPGPHVFLLVVQASRFTREERNSVEALQELFGPKADRFMMVLFTHTGDLSSNINDFLREGSQDLRTLVHRCGNRFHGFENNYTGEDQSRQVEELFKKIEEMEALNAGNYYTNKMYKEVEERRAQHQNGDKSYTFIGALMKSIERFLNILKRD